MAFFKRKSLAAPGLAHFVTIHFVVCTINAEACDKSHLQGSTRVDTSIGAGSVVNYIHGPNEQHSFVHAKMHLDPLTKVTRVMLFGLPCSAVQNLDVFEADLR
jgi:hypothetical protein